VQPKRKGILVAGAPITVRQNFRKNRDLKSG
jgi:hypothetical protein